MEDKMKVIIALLVFGFTLSIPNALASRARVSNCMLRQLGQLQYMATFKLKGQTKDKMQIRVGKVTETSGTIMEIMTGNECKVVCHPKTLEKDAKNLVVSMDMKCQANALDSLSTTATLFLANGQGRFPKLRLGNWLDGYQEAFLRVELDRFK